MFDRRKAEIVYKNFITWIYKLVVEQKNDFDLIVGPANSGIFLAESVKIFYEQAGIKLPKVLIMPIQRREVPGTDKGRHFDNSVVSSSIREELTELKKLENVLFVDDEIGKAYTPKEVIRVVLMSVDKNIIPDRILYTIVAENHGFEWRYDLPPVAIRYYSFGNKIKWAKTDESGRVVRDDSGMDLVGPHINGSVFYILPDDIYERYKSYSFELDETRTRAIGKKELAALFSNGHIQTSKNNIPILTTEVLEKIRRDVPQFDSDKKDFMQYVQGLIRDVITNHKEYEQSKVFQD